MFEADQGLSTSYWTQPLDPVQPWHRPVQQKDRRYTPKKFGGPRFRHPFRPPIIYPRLPDKRYNFDQDAQFKVTNVVTKTMDSSVVTKFVDKPEDRIVTEVWQADSLSTEIEFYRCLAQYYTEPLPVGEYIGWQPKDASWKNFFIELLQVQVGQAEDFLLEELGDGRPYLMREQLTVKFKLVREIIPPVSSIVVTGA